MGEYSAPVPLYRFVEARVSSGLPRGDDDVHWTVSILTNDHEEAEMQRRYPKWDRIRRFKMQPKEFARLLAKIAHAYVVAECGLSGFWPSNCDIILGQSDDCFSTVGGRLDIPPPDQDAGDHRIEMNFECVAPFALVRVDIRLVARANTPLYHVYAGLIDLRVPDHLHAFEKHIAEGRVKIARPA